MRLPPLLGKELPENLQPALREWFTSELGRRVLSREENLLEDVLPRCFGFHAVHMGMQVEGDLLASSLIAHRFAADRALLKTRLSTLVCDPEAMPLAGDSVDLVFLHHSLDVVSQPHAWLREAARVLVPEGHLLVVGFNPWSLWGISRIFRGPWQHLPWLHRPVSPSRLADWLSLLDFDVLGLETTYHYPPMRNTRWERYFAWLDWLGRRYWRQAGAVYVLLAKKRNSCLTPLRLRSDFRRRMVPPFLVPDGRSVGKSILRGRGEG